jgi:hypothetical protein
MITLINGLRKRAHSFARYEVELLVKLFTSLFIQYYVSAHSIPTSIILNHAVSFQGHFWPTFTKAIRFHLLFIMTFYTQIDRLAKKANNSFQIFLCPYSTNNVTICDDLPMLAEFAYKAITHKVTLVVPFKADQDYIPCLTIEFFLALEPNALAVHEDAPSFTDRVKSRLRATR